MASPEVRTYESIPIANSGQVWMIVTCVLTIVIPSSLVVLRFIARSRFSSAPLDSSDWCIAAAMVSRSAHAHIIGRVDRRSRASRRIRG